ncbi:hypothetical protein WJX75_006660 [Coccomyxa subellipsoidea]|uniref:Uncharacterized protein n=1 Tax=Coccomyxa subellipsoidea TaxID=248742 RepID=A0ABR2YI22_9CHLO
MVRSDLYGILIHCALSCVGVFVTRPTSGLSLYYTAQALGSFKIIQLMMILLSPTSYIRIRDAMLVTMRFFDSASSLIQTSVLHGQRFLPDLTPTQFHLRAFFVWFGAFFGAVSKQPPANLNFILTLLHLVGRIALYNIYFQAMAPHFGKMAPAAGAAAAAAMAPQSRP